MVLGAFRGFVMQEAYIVSRQSCAAELPARFRRERWCFRLCARRKWTERWFWRWRIGALLTVVLDTIPFPGKSGHKLDQSSEIHLQKVTWQSCKRIDFVILPYTLPIWVAAPTEMTLSSLLDREGQVV